MTPLFYKEIGTACENLGESDKAVENYRLAVEGFNRCRESNDLNKSDDWLKDTQSLNKKLNDCWQNFREPHANKAKHSDNFSLRLRLHYKAARAGSVMR